MRLLTAVAVLFIVCSSDKGVIVDGGTITSELSKLTDGTEMHSALKEIKSLKIGGAIVNELMKVSPLLSTIYNDVANQNAEAKIALDVVGGHMPSVKDLLHLLSTEVDVSDAVHMGFRNSKPYQELSGLMSKQGFETSKDDLTRSIFLFTGHQFDLSSAMVADPKTGQFKVTSDVQNPYRNLIEGFLFLHDNWRIISMLLDYPNMKYDHLKEIKVMENSKYSVSHSDVLEITKLAKAAQAERKQERTLQDVEQFVDLTSKTIQVISKSIQQALAAESSVVG